jgi:hypothetical protein
VIIDNLNTAPLNCFGSLLIFSSLYECYGLWMLSEGNNIFQVMACLFSFNVLEIIFNMSEFINLEERIFPCHGIGKLKSRYIQVHCRKKLASLKVDLYR